MYFSANLIITQYMKKNISITYILMNNVSDYTDDVFTYLCNESFWIEADLFVIMQLFNKG